MNRINFIAMIMMTIMMISLANGVPKSLQIFSRVLDSPIYQVYNLISGQITSQSTLNTTEFQVYGVLEQTSKTNLLLIGLKDQRIVTQNYFVHTNKLLFESQASNNILFQMSTQTFGYDSTNNFVYACGFYESNTLAFVSINFTRQFMYLTTINYELDIETTPIPIGLYDQENRLYYMFVADTFYESIMVTYSIASHNYTQKRIPYPFVGYTYVYPFLYNSILYICNVDPIYNMSKLNILDLVSGDTKLVLEQPIFYNQDLITPFIFDPQGYLIILSPLSDDPYPNFNVTTISLDTLSVIYYTQFTNIFPKHITSITVLD